MEYVLTTLYIISCFVLIMFVLLQPGKSDAAAVFGGGANSSAFGPRGTQSVMAKVTIAAAILFFLIAFLFSIPNLFGKKSLGEGVGPAEVQQVTPESQIPVAPAPTEATPGTAPATTPVTPPAGNAATPPAADTKGAAKPADAKKPATTPPAKKTP